MPTIIQVAGAALVVLGIGILSIPISLIVAGIATVLFGIALERK